MSGQGSRVGALGAIVLVAAMVLAPAVAVPAWVTFGSGSIWVPAGAAHATTATTTDLAVRPLAELVHGAASTVDSGPAVGTNLGPGASLGHPASFAPERGLRLPGNLETSAAVEAKTWQGYENRVRDLYGAMPYEQRQYQSILNGEVVNGVADNVIAGSNIAVEAKFVQGGRWASSLRNPWSSIGRFGFSKAERIKMIMQARKYAGAFDEVIYHSNSLQFIAHYSLVFRRMGIKNARWVHTPIVR